ncbi:hypothetical protein ABIE09_002986 [Lysobacter enzymogenes]|uniref:hypothetical protein n=1 Tax=Lysobacter enzymogenes TaxID=69 RepID=UPI0019D19467|nr:hypothetical protein [Lysobacter enzymogenes]MBN7134847.1 hypothetical protein [Lysobacter enzymogenes]
MTQRSNHRRTNSQAIAASNESARAAQLRSTLLKAAPAIASIILALVLITSLTSAGYGFV